MMDTQGCGRNLCSRIFHISKRTSAHGDRSKILRQNNMNYLINQVLSGNTISKGLWGAFLWKLLCLIAVLAAVGCATVPHTGRRQFNMVSDQQLSALALKAFNEVVAKEPPSKDQRLNEIVRKVAERVSKAAEMIDKPKFDWEVRVIDRDVPNAFCLPGGKIVVCTGMVPYARNEAGLAAVIAHETAHAVARHSGERLSQQVALKGAIAVGGEVLKRKMEAWTLKPVWLWEPWVWAEQSVSCCRTAVSMN